MKILFLHGWKSVPGGVKPTYLRDRGNEVINPKLDDDDFEYAFQVAQQQFDIHQPDIVIGSSRGGALAMNLRTGGKPRVLLCPAWKKWGQVKTIPLNTLVLHSREDEVIPFEDSEELIRRSGLSNDNLIEVGRDHRMADSDSLATMWWACQLLQSGEILPQGDEPTGPLALASEEASYVCDSCGEEIVVPLDLSEGALQRYVEDCPVCCNPNVIHVRIDDDGTVTLWSEPEQDHE